jgi:hypothetical protein
MCLTVREEPVNDQTQDREEEYSDTPQELVGRWAVGFEDFHCLHILAPYRNSKMQTRYRKEVNKTY